MELDNRTLELYSRQILVDEIGYDGQVKLLETTVSLDGAGLIADLAARYLARAGLHVVAGDRTPGRIRIHVDQQVFEMTENGSSMGADVANLGLTLGLVIREIVGSAGLGQGEAKS